MYGWCKRTKEEGRGVEDNEKVHSQMEESSNMGQVRVKVTQSYRR